MEDLYQEHILDHFSHPRLKGSLAVRTHHATATNASCGDTLAIDLIVEDGVVVDLRWSGVGCAVSQAAASILAEEMIGQSIETYVCLRLPEVTERLGVEISPAREKCAMLFVRTLKNIQQA